MSEPSKEHAPEPATPGGILGSAIGILALLGCLTVVITYGSRLFDSAEGLGESFKFNEVPGALALQEEAFLLPTGEKVYILSDGVVVEDGSEVTEMLMGFDIQHGVGSGESGDEEAYDWSGVEILSQETSPSRVFLVQYPRERADSVIRSQFQGIDWRDLTEIDADGGRAAVEGGKLRWSGYSADFVRERTFIEGGTFRDTVRVNLSLGQECWIAYAIWPVSHEGSSAKVGELLSAFEPLGEAPLES